MNKLLLVYNYPIDNISNQWLYKGLKLKYNSVNAIGITPFFSKFLYKKKYKWLHFLGRYFLSFKSVNLAKKEKYDAIIVWDNTFLGVNTALWTYLRRYNGKLFVLNMIDHSNRLIVLRKIIYSFFNRNNVYISVNNCHLKQRYHNIYGIDINRFFILPDTCSNQDDILKIPLNDNRYIFCGGSSNRDWKCFVEVAKCCSNIKFVGVARKDKFLNICKKEDIPENVRMYFDIKGEDFFRLIANSSFVFLPLTSNIQAGQTVVIQAGLMKKAIVMNYTESIASYIDENSGILYKFDASYENIATILNQLFFNKKRYDIMGENLNVSMRTHTPQYVIEVLNEKLSHNI